MNIYAIKDRLIDYYLMPFAAPDDKSVMAAIAATINSETTNDAISYAPHHFEIWKLGKVEETGHITSHPELIADCSSLVRRDIRKRQSDLTRSPEDREPDPSQPSTADRRNGPPGASERPSATPTPGEDRPRA